MFQLQTLGPTLYCMSLLSYALSPLHIQIQVEEYKKTSNFLIEIMVLYKLFKRILIWNLQLCFVP